MLFFLLINDVESKNGQAHFKATGLGFFLNSFFLLFLTGKKKIKFAE